MAIPNSSIKSSAPAAPDDPGTASSVPYLDLSSLGPFRSQPTRVVNADAFITFMLRFLREAGPRPDFMKQRADDRCHVEFDLEHPERTGVSYDANEINQLFDLCEKQRAGG